jgi:Predicted NADH:ubiquinone oxidoreductase, subunit RnfA
MANIIYFFAAALTALAMENVIFFRGVGLDQEFLFLKSPRMGILYGSVFTLMATLCSVGAWGVTYLLQSSIYIDFIRAPLCLFFVCAAYASVYYGTRRFFPDYYAKIRHILPISTFNTGLFSALFVISTRNYNLFRAIGYALGTGAGFTLAILIIYLARKRLVLSPVPRTFRGLPILLIYMGLLSLALYGLIGQGLPG